MARDRENDDSPGDFKFHRFSQRNIEKGFRFVMGVPPNHPKSENFSIETHGDLG
jgi:hypothetical protein